MATQSTMLELGTSAPDFRLPDFEGKVTALADFHDARGLVVAFICNHCPFVKHIRNEFARFAREYQPRGIAVVAINSNDIQAYPADGPEGMASEARSAGYTFPYLLDENQAAARAYRAVCTPTCFCSMRSANWCIEASSMTVDPAKARPQAPICAQRATPCSAALTYHRTKSRASAAVSNGRNNLTVRAMFLTRRYKFVPKQAKGATSARPSSSI